MHIIIACALTFNCAGLIFTEGTCKSLQNCMTKSAARCVAFWTVSRALYTWKEKEDWLTLTSSSCKLLGWIVACFCTHGIFRGWPESRR